VAKSPIQEALERIRRGQTQQPQTQQRQSGGAVRPSLQTQLAVSQIQKRLYGIWRLPDGARNAERLLVVIRAFLRPDGSVESTQIMDMARVARDPFYRRAAESAQRAVQLGGPYKELPRADYQRGWRYVDFRFDPRNAF